MNKGLVFVFLALFAFTRCTALSILVDKRTEAGGDTKRSLRGNNEAMDVSEDERAPTNFHPFEFPILESSGTLPIEKNPSFEKAITAAKSASHVSKPPTYGQTIFQLIQNRQPSVNWFKSHDIDPFSITTKIARLRSLEGLLYDRTKYRLMAFGSVLLNGKLPTLDHNKKRAEELVTNYFVSLESEPLMSLIIDISLDLPLIEQKMQWLVQKTKDPEKHLDMIAHMAAGDQLFVQYPNLGALS